MRMSRSPASTPGRVADIRCWGLVFLGIATAAAGADVDRARLVAAGTGVLKVEVSSEAGGYSLGTAVSVAPGRFLTNCHVTRHARAIAVLHEGTRWPVTGESSDVELDLCLLEVPGLADVEPVRLGSARGLHVGHPVAALGYARGLGLQARTGVIQALHPLHGSVVIQSTAPFSGGASGGGLFNENGELVGILTFRLPGADGYFFATPVDWIAPRIASTGTFAMVAPLAGPAAYWARPPAQLPYFMQAASLEAGADWGALVAFAGKWADAERGNAEPWFERGEACEHLGRDDDALAAYRQAVVLDPAFAAAWSHLGVMLVRSGDRREVDRVVATLQDLDEPAAAALAAKRDRMH